MSEPPAGTSAPVYRSLTAPMLVAGVPRNVAIVLGMAGGVFVAGWHIYQLIPIIIVAYFAAAWACKRDPHIFSIIAQNRGQGRRYLP